MGTPARLRLRDAIRSILTRGVTTYSELTDAGAATNGTLGRIVEDDGQNVRLSVLDDLAYALGVEPWQLIHPDGDLASMSEASIRIARKMETVAPEARDRVYAHFVQNLDFANVPRVAPASAPEPVKPKRLRKVPK